MRTTRILLAGMAGLVAARAGAQPAATLTLVPVGGTEVQRGQVVAVEAFFTAHRAIELKLGAWDSPCIVAAQPGGTGVLTVPSAGPGGTTDPDGDGVNGPSAGGVPFIFGPSGLGPYAPATCKTALTPPIGVPSMEVMADSTTYLGTRFVQVSANAVGDFVLNAECSDQPGGLCDSTPEPTNTTRFTELAGGGPPQGTLLSMNFVGTTLTVAPCVGPEDSDGDGWADSCDNCPAIANPDQANSDGDDEGDVCDACPNDDCEDGLTCTQGACNAPSGQCTQLLVSGCLIDEACYFSGQRNPADVCLRCNPTVSQTVWTDVELGCPMPVTLSLEPVAGGVIRPGDLVPVEAFLTANESLSIKYGQFNLPCSVSAQPGGSGTVTVLSGAEGGTTDPDGDGIQGPSDSGVPYVYGVAGLGPFAPAGCHFANNPGIGQSPPNLGAGTIWYIGTLYYEVSTNAAGDFLLNFECNDQPGDLCDSLPESTNTTRYRMDEPPGEGNGVLIPLGIVGTTLSVDPCYFADIVPLGGNGVIDVDDLTCVLLSFVNRTDCMPGDIEPCGGDGDVDVDDILLMLGAFLGEFLCPNTCP